MWANGNVLFADSPRVAKNKLNTHADSCQLNGLEINRNETITTVYNQMERTKS